MKKLGIFLILALLLILLISCGKSTSDSSSVTNCTTSGTPSSVLPSSSTKPQDTETPVTTTAQATETQVTSTSMATETQPISTSDVPKTDPTVIRVVFWLHKGPISCPLFVAYEIPKSCSLSDETIPITLYFALDEACVPNDASEEDHFEIYLWDNANLTMYPLRNITIKEARSKNYIRPDSVQLFSSHSETFEIPLSIFSEEKSNTWDVCVDYYREDNTLGGCNSVFLQYEKINGETIVFSPDLRY